MRVLLFSNPSLEDGVEEKGRFIYNRCAVKSFLCDEAQDSHHGNTSVLDFNGTTTGEGIDVIDQTKGIEKVQWTGVDTQTIRGARVRVDGGRGSGLYR